MQSYGAAMCNHMLLCMCNHMVSYELALQQAQGHMLGCMDAAHDTMTVGGHERISTLSVISEAEMTKKPPMFDPEKGMANHKKFFQFVKAAYANATAQDLVDAGVGPIASGALQNRGWRDYMEKNVGVGAYEDGSLVLLDSTDDYNRATFILADLTNRLSPSKGGDKYTRYSPAERVEIRRADELLASRTIARDFRSTPRGRKVVEMLGEKAVNEFFYDTMLTPKLMTDKSIKSIFPKDYTQFLIISPASRQLIAKTLGIDPELVNNAAGETPEVNLAEKLAEASLDQLAAVIDALAESTSRINFHYIKSLGKVLFTREYMSFMEQTMARIVDVQQQRRYEKTISDRESATVYQEKKHIPESHLEAAQQSVFARSGDFSHVEIDESVELDLMGKIEAEWEVLRDALPHSDVKATLRFRKTGRHKAAGIYHPFKHNIAVDPRHPYSFVHEYFHHLDYTLGADADTRQLSLSEDFSQLLHKIQKQIRETPGMDKLDYYTTPTEVFARGGELACYWSGLATSLNGNERVYAEPVYSAYEPYREELIAWYHEHLGLDIEHERALQPAALAPPALSDLNTINQTPEVAAAHEQPLDR